MKKTRIKIDKKIKTPNWAFLLLYNFHKYFFAYFKC